MGRWQAGHCEPGWLRLIPRGSRNATTFKKLPSAPPNAAASATSTKRPVSLTAISRSRMSVERSFIEKSNDSGQRPARGAQGIDTPADLGVFDQRRRVMGLQAGVDHERAATAPVLLFNKR